MSRLLIIGCGGVAQVAIRKCCQNSEVFTEIMIASRTKSKCDDLKAKLEGKTSTKIETAKVDADNVEELKELISAYKPDAVLNVALPYQDLTIMDACLACVLTTSILPTMSVRILRIQSGEQSTKSAARSLDLRHILIIHGSGHIRRNLRRQVLQLFLEADLTRV